MDTRVIPSGDSKCLLDLIIKRTVMVKAVSEAEQKSTSLTAGRHKCVWGNVRNWRHRGDSFLRSLALTRKEKSQ